MMGYIVNVYHQIDSNPANRRLVMEEKFEEAVRVVDQQVPFAVKVSFPNFKRKYYGYTGKKRQE